MSIRWQSLTAPGIVLLRDQMKKFIADFLKRRVVFQLVNRDNGATTDLPRESSGCEYLPDLIELMLFEVAEKVIDYADLRTLDLRIDVALAQITEVHNRNVDLKANERK